MQTSEWGLVSGLSALAGIAACGGATTAGAAKDDKAGHEVDADIVVDSGVIRDAGIAWDAGGADAGNGSTGDDADSEATCNDLDNAAVAQFNELTPQYQTCSSDSECSLLQIDGSGFCVDPCGGVLTNEVGAFELSTAATTACQAFVAHGCTGPYLPCPRESTLTACISGLCAVWLPLLSTTTRTFVHGICAPFESSSRLTSSRRPRPATSGSP